MRGNGGKIVVMMVRVDVVAVSGAKREQNFNRSDKCESADTEAANRRRRACRRINQTPFSRGIVRHIVERIARIQQESSDGAESEHDLADDERGECATGHEE
ncbi:MAG TPA: hypothetical protein VEU51_00965 [Candidatus Acidoferrales bacterium]|nr:hypothetical protein [Candidatus Acidoferrales bacterium]